MYLVTFWIIDTMTSELYDLQGPRLTYTGITGHYRIYGYQYLDGPEVTEPQDLQDHSSKKDIRIYQRDCIYFTKDLFIDG